MDRKHRRILTRIRRARRGTPATPGQEAFEWWYATHKRAEATPTGPDQEAWRRFAEEAFKNWEALSDRTNSTPGQPPPHVTKARELWLYAHAEAEASPGVYGEAWPQLEQLAFERYEALVEDAVGFKHHDQPPT